MFYTHVVLHPDDAARAYERVAECALKRAAELRSSGKPEDGTSRRSEWLLHPIEAEAEALAASSDDGDEVLYVLADKSVHDWRLDDALRLSNLIRAWKAERTWIRNSLALKLSRIGRRDEAIELLSESVQICEEISQVWLRAESLAKIAETFASLGDVDRAYEIWMKASALALGVQTPNFYDEGGGVGHEIATDLAAAGFLDQARKIATEIESESRRSFALEQISRITEARGKRGHSPYPRAE